MRLPTPQQGNRRDMDNIPAWQTRSENNGKRSAELEANSLPSDDAQKKGRLWVFTAQILATSASESNLLIPLDVENGLPGVELWFVRDSSSEIGLLCRLECSNEYG